MAKRKVAIICGISWAMFAIALLLPLTITGNYLAFGIMLQVGLMVGIISLIALAIMALIDYARRPSSK